MRAKLWAPIGVAACFVTIGIVGGILATSVFEVKDELESAIPLAQQAQDRIITGDTAGAAAVAADLAKKTEAAKQHTESGLWRAAEVVPILGPNLSAVRTATEVADSLSASVVSPLSGVSLDSLKPVDGRFDLDEIALVAGVLDTANVAVADADSRLAAVNRDGLLGQVTSALDKLTPQLTSAGTALSAASAATAILPDALGAAGPRNYLMLFQNNAESRGTGGNPAAVLLLTANDGVLSIARQGSSGDFNNGREVPVISLDEETQALYGDKIGRYMQDMTLTPDFPTTAAIAQAWWAESFGDPIDGVVSFDPVGLSYLLSATGPVSLPTGEQLTAENTVPLLLNEIYFRYEEPEQQDAFFAAAAGSVFSALTSGSGNTTALVDALQKSVDEGRLIFWSAYESQAELIAGTRVEGRLPTTNDDSAVMGVYINDTTASKMDYYVDLKIATERSCAADSDASAVTVTLTSTVDPAMADSLPAYVTGRFYPHAQIATDVVIYAPLGMQLSEWAVDGVPVAPTYIGEHLGRSVVKLPVILNAGRSLAITYTVGGDSSTVSVPLEIWHTPMVRQTPVDIAQSSCAIAAG